MNTTADNLRDLHLLHQRLEGAARPFVLGAQDRGRRQAALANRQSAIEASRKALQEAKVQLKKREHSIQSHQAKIDDLRDKMNQVKKNEEYKAIQNQIALDKGHIEKLEGEVLEEMVRIDEKATAQAADEAEVKKFADEFATLKEQVESQAAPQRVQLQELEAAIVEAEDVIPEDLRERYRRTLKQHGADAMAPVEHGACSGCFVTVTAQMMNDLINAETLTFCRTCGRILYLAEEDVLTTRRTAR